MARQSKPTIIQSVLLSRQHFCTSVYAQRWLMLHGFKIHLDTTPHTFRARQIDPKKFVHGSFRTIKITNGIKAVIGRLKKI